MMVSIGLRMIRKTIVSKAKFDIKYVFFSTPPAPLRANSSRPPRADEHLLSALYSKLEPIAVVGSCFIPALFVHGESDTFIGPHHSHELYSLPTLRIRSSRR